MSLLNPEENVFKPFFTDESLQSIADPDGFLDPFFHDDLLRDIDFTFFNPNEFRRTFTVGYGQNHETDRVVPGIMTQAPSSIDSRANVAGFSVNQMMFCLKKKDFEDLPDNKLYRNNGYIFINHQQYLIKKIDLDYGYVMFTLEAARGVR